MNSRITDLLSVVHSVAKVASKIADSQTQRISRSLPSLSNTIPTLNNTSSFGDDSLLRDIQKFNQNDTIDSSRPRNVVEAMEDKNSPNMLYLNDGPTEEQTQISELHDSGQLKLNSGAADAGGKPATGANAFKIDEDVKQSLAVQTDLAQLDELNRKRSETVTNSRSYTPTTSTAPPEPSYPRPLIDSSIPSPANTAKLFNEESITKSPPIEDSGGKPLSSSTVPILEDSTSSSANHEDQIPSEGTQAPKQLKEARVSTTRIGRLFQYGGLVARLGVGAVGEAVRRATGQSKPLIEGASPLLSEANIERIVAKLSEMRGAALKLGQIISIQDSNVMPKQIEELLSKVQNSANYMPKRQMLGVMKSELGPSPASAWSEHNSPMSIGYIFAQQEPEQSLNYGHNQLHPHLKTTLIC